MFKRLRVAVVGVAAAALLTGCGSDSGDTGKSAGDDTGKAPASKTASPAGKSGGATHEVTLQVTGSGTTQVMYHAASSSYGEQQQLPWTKTETVELTEAEQKVGYLVLVTPGSVKAADGTLKMAGCVIKVDGKQVADNDDGNTAKPCKYKIK
ncbi:hypothetical protein NGF19_00995 [Streptomyces sp. RY43-2]|uniref:MmpS family membrane protein n=1 Tax=Streptomyces macrolidinus TaxID=2952607 RepID=A0ABT0Z6J0_9ACTN|nr:hypothetical protein [Streptomyces macrolidinus]MCN9239373.1 hypothetical protein [Streptomyces macrolidinus]